MKHTEGVIQFDGAEDADQREEHIQRGRYCPVVGARTVRSARGEPKNERQQGRRRKINSQAFRFAAVLV